jgi:polysaccharide biosynthesis PFTS motif protein
MFFYKKSSFYQRAKLRNAMRGYQILNKERKLGAVTRIKNDLCNTKLNCQKKTSSLDIFGAGKESSELILRQFLMERLLGIDFNKNLLAAISDPKNEIECPLPLEWRNVLASKGFKVNTAKNKFRWRKFVFKNLFYGIATILIQSIKNIKESLTLSSRPIENYAYFHSLSPGNIPTPNQENYIGHNVIYWYCNWLGRSIFIKRVLHSVRASPQIEINNINIQYSHSPIPHLNSFKGTCKYMVWGINVILIALFDIFRSRYWHALILRESSKAVQVRLQNSEYLAKDYLFHNASPVYRPLWTYDVEKKGSRILFYFYSTNVESFKTSSGYVQQEPFWHLMNWPNYLVWDDYQSNFVKRVAGDDNNVYIVGPLSLAYSNNEDLHINSKKTIAVFDVQPFRNSRFQLLGAVNDYYTPRTNIKFLTDIVKSAEKNNLEIIFKRKRNIGKLTNREYENCISYLNKSKHFISVDSEIDSEHIINHSLAAISLPFTSTALLAKELGKPSIYYDPYSQVQRDDRAAHDIDVISNMDKLNLWMSSI